MQALKLFAQGYFFNINFTPLYEYMHVMSMTQNEIMKLNDFKSLLDVADQTYNKGINKTIT